MTVRYEEISAKPQLETALSKKNTVWLLIIGDGDWRDAVIKTAKEQVEDQPQFMALWMKDPSLITPEEKTHFLGDKPESIVCAIAKNGGVLPEKLDAVKAKKGARVAALIHQAESYSGNGYCVKHGEFTGNSCGKC